MSLDVPTNKYTGWSDEELWEEVDERGDGLTRWETEFHESIKKQLDDGRELSERQRAVLMRIIEEKTNGD